MAIYDETPYPLQPLSQAIGHTAGHKMPPAVDTMIDPYKTPYPHHKPTLPEFKLQSDLACDIVQLVLDITGIIDPTPTSDGLNTLVYLGRGRFWDAAISAVSMIPYAGDLAKLGRLPKYLNTIKKAIREARRDIVFSRYLRPVMYKLSSLLDDVLKHGETLLPKDALKLLHEMREEVKGYLEIGYMPKAYKTPETPKPPRIQSKTNSNSEPPSANNNTPDPKKKPDNEDLKKGGESGDNGGAVEGESVVAKYEVGAFNDLTKRSKVGDKLDIHHATQKHPAGQVIDGYDPKTAPSIAVPAREHRRIPTIKGQYNGNARDLLAKDIKDLRQYTNARNSALQNLIRLNKETSPAAFKK